MEENQVSQSWFKRNWKWAVPAGGCLIVGGLLIAFVLSLVMGVKTLFKDSEPYKMALKKAQESEWVISRLGEPILQEGMPQGNINYNSDESTAELAIPVKGSNDEGQIEVWAKKTGDNWSYNVLRITVDDTGETYDLLNNRLLPPKED